MNNIDGKVILITGGTGSFGSTFLRLLIRDYKPKKIIVFSRDEDKQHRLRLELNSPLVEFQVGCVRDRERVFKVMQGVHVVFHAAALKQVPSGEFFPMEHIKTNVLGANNVLDAAIECGVERVVVLSTDKAVYPICTMGITKALMEKLAISKAKEQHNTKICVTRYGNVMCSRGSIIPIFLKSAKNNEPLTVTEGTMTRFLLSLEDACSLVLYAINNCEGGEIFVKKAPACTIQALAEAIINITKSTSYIQKIGIRHGEKMHESLLSSEEMNRVVDCVDYYKVLPDTRDINYTVYFEEGKPAVILNSYTSENTHRLYDDEVAKVLLDLKEVQDELEK
jgi:UDP-glucose 4-epimerase